MSKIDEPDEGRLEDGETLSAGINQEGTSEAQDRRSSLFKRDLTIFLFGRTGREKEDWFQRFLSASNVRVNMKKRPSVGISTKGQRLYLFIRTCLLIIFLILKSKSQLG